jgi:peptidoglycan/LPS O-acetylase OafA/YrhL
VKHFSYRADIDGLRAVAILAVVVHHAFPDLVPGGFIGVDVFFVISGYLITGILVHQLDSEQFSLGTFYLRRMRRLFPALLVVLASCLLLGWFILLPDEYQQLGKHVAGGGAFIANWLLLGEAGYFDVASQVKPLLHLWSLGIEEQFYLFWPVMLMLVWLKRWPLLPLLSLSLMASLLANLYWSQVDTAVAFYTPFTRLWELAVGGVLALLKLNKIIKIRFNIHHHPFVLHGMVLTGLFLIVGAAMLMNKDMIFPGYLALFPVTGAALIIYAGHSSCFAGWVLANRPMIWLGLISYPLYLWHWPILTFVRIQYGKAQLPVSWSILLICVSVFLSLMTYLYIERPIQGIGFPHRPTLIALAGGMLFLIISASMVYINKGLPKRAGQEMYAEKLAQLQRMKEDPEISHQKCMEQYGLEGYVRYCNLSGESPRVAFIGDSHARAMFDGMAPYLAEQGQSLLNVGGRLFLGIDVYLKGSSFEMLNNLGSQQATQMVIDNPDIEHVVMFALGPAYVSGRTNHVFTLQGSPEVKDPLAIWEQGMRMTFQAMEDAGKKVTFVLNNPELPFDPRVCVKRPVEWFSQARTPCAMTREEFNQRAQPYRDLMQRIVSDYPSVQLFDLAEYLCDEDLCYAQKDGLLLYRDDNHLSPAGARYIAPALWRSITRFESQQQSASSPSL